MQKPKLLLLDANVVIEAYEIGIWAQIKSHYEVAVPSIIVSEARYFVSEDTQGGISLKKQVDAGEIKVFEGTVEEIADVFANIHDIFLAGIDDGEKEGIALIAAGKCPGYCFCTGDINAVQAMGMLKLTSQSVSFEKVVAGAKLGKKISPHCTEKAHAHHVKIGLDRRLSGEYFKKPLL